jgi:hypothetical protein
MLKASSLIRLGATALAFFSSAVFANPMMFQFSLAQRNFDGWEWIRATVHFDDSNFTGGSHRANTSLPALGYGYTLTNVTAETAQASEFTSDPSYSPLATTFTSGSMFVGIYPSSISDSSNRVQFRFQAIFSASQPDFRYGQLSEIFRYYPGYYDPSWANGLDPMTLFVTETLDGRAILTARTGNLIGYSAAAASLLPVSNNGGAIAFADFTIKDINLTSGRTPDLTIPISPVLSGSVPTPGTIMLLGFGLVAVTVGRKGRQNRLPKALKTSA